MQLFKCEQSLACFDRSQWQVKCAVVHAHPPASGISRKWYWSWMMLNNTQNIQNYSPFSETRLVGTDFIIRLEMFEFFSEQSGCLNYCLTQNNHTLFMLASNVFFRRGFGKNTLKYSFKLFTFTFPHFQISHISSINIITIQYLLYHIINE